MTTFHRLLLCAAAVAAAVVPLRAQDREPAAIKGRVLVLDNERTAEGDIERVGGQYRIRRALGETWVPDDHVLGLFADVAEAYRFLLRRANPEDPDERLRLARWCHAQGLPDQALDNVRAAVRLRPKHAASRRLLESLERAAAAAPPAPAAPAVVPESAAVPELTTESLGVFATKVQPILMNACAGCHASGRGGAFKLTRGYDSTTASRRSLQQNLAAVLAQVNLNQPQASPLLTKAVSAHGDIGQAPLGGKQLAAYHTLEEWVDKTLTRNPHLREHAAPATPQGEAKGLAAAPTKPPVKPADGAPTEAAAGKFADGRPTPPASAAPVDPFDPVQFNRPAGPSK